MQIDRASSVSMWWFRGTAFCSATKTVARMRRESRKGWGKRGDCEVEGRARL